MSTTTHFNEDTQKYLVEGINLVANAVRKTLGAAGTTVVIQQGEDKSPIITKDGVTVAKSIHPKDERVRLGSDLAISVAQKQLNAVGDGTTTATVLAQALVSAGVRHLNMAESTVNRTALRTGIEKARDYVIEKLNSYAKEITSDEELEYIATVSANGDTELGKVVAEAYRKVGKAGVVLVEETKDRNTTLDFKEGMTFNKGWTSQFFITNHNDQTCELDDPVILLSDSKVSNFASLANLIQPVLKSGKPLVIIAESFDTSVTQALAMNVVRSAGQLKVVCVEAPGYAQRRLDILRDIATYTGAQVADDPMGTKFEAITQNDFGSCEKIIVKKDETIIRGGKGDPEKVKERITSIEGLINACAENDTYEREQLGKRLASLTTGVAVIRVGGSSEEEIKEYRDRLEDSQFAVKAALEEGYLPGAGNTLLFLSENVIKEVKGNTSDEQMGIEIFAHALKAPVKTILENAGQPAETIMKDILMKDDINEGFNVRTLQYVNLVYDGIIDPKKVVAGAVYAASSIASIALTSSVMVTIDPEEHNNMMMPPMM